MISAPIHSKEPLRLATLRSLKILDTDAEQEFDDITELASRICNVPISLISLIDKDRQWFKASKGISLKQISRNISICAHTINQKEIFIVPDALEDMRFWDNPMVIQKPNLRFYAGVSICTEDGVALGTLCIVDYQPRLLTSEQIFCLEALSRQVEALLKLRMKVYEAEELNKALSKEIEERRKLEYELLEAKKHAEKSAKAKESFLANMSHEIRTPMNAIKGMANQLGKSTLSNEQRSFLNNIRTASDNLLVVINDILDTSKIEAGKLSLERIGFVFKETVENTIRVMSFKSEEKGVPLYLSIDHEIAPVLLGDPFRLNQILLNLVSNAIKFTQKGKIQVECTVAASTAHKQLICMKVSDTGIGMEKEFLKCLFDNFAQEDQSMARTYGGTGLGMSITKHLVELMGGTIHVQSFKGEGSVFTITLPFIIGSELDLPTKGNAHFDDELLKGKRILLAEDNEMNRFLVSTILENHEVDLVEACNGEEAIAILKKQDFDLVLMDIQMPVMDGWDATRIIRKEIGSTVPVIALTANAIEGERDKCLTAGMNAFLSKPFEEEELIKLISHWIKIASCTL